MIDPNEAPDGFVAVAGFEACKGCSFFDDGECLNPKARCFPYERHDGKYVIFIPREKSNLAELSNIGDLAESMARNERLSAIIANQAERIRYLEGATNHATGTPLSKGKDEAARWKSAHDHVCKELAACEEARDENAELCNKARADLITCRNELISRDNLIQKLKSQLTAALESIARMR